MFLFYSNANKTHQVAVVEGDLMTSSYADVSELMTSSRADDADMLGLSAGSIQVTKETVTMQGDDVPSMMSMSMTSSMYGGDLDQPEMQDLMTSSSTTSGANVMASSISDVGDLMTSSTADVDVMMSSQGGVTGLMTTSTADMGDLMTSSQADVTDLMTSSQADEVDIPVLTAKAIEQVSHGGVEIKMLQPGLLGRDQVIGLVDVVCE